MPQTFINTYPEDRHRRCNKLELSYEVGRWRTVSKSGLYGLKFTAKGTHIFVVLDGKLIVAHDGKVLGERSPVSHIDLADGRPVEFAGEIRFGGRSNKRGILDHWNDKSGHYHNPKNGPMDPKLVPLLPQELYRPYSPGGGQS